MGRRVAVVALWMAVVASALAVPTPTDNEDQAALQHKGEYWCCAHCLLHPHRAWFSQYI
jgi:hypothetical protein